MPSQQRNMPEQEHSIRQRSHELFVESGQPGEGTKPTRPFPAYLRETPAQPLSPFTKAVFWFLGLVVLGLFLAAVWRISTRQKTKSPVRKAPAKTAMIDPRDNQDRQRLARLEGEPNPLLASNAYFPDAEPPEVIRYKWTP